jgi:hypothetical protein
MNVSVRLYNYLGSEVLSTPQATKSTGQHSLKLETRTLSPGVYIVKLEIGSAIISKKIIGVFLKSPFYVGQFIWAQRDTNVGGTTFCIYKTMYR